MQIIDSSNAFDEKQKGLILEIADQRLATAGLRDRIYAIELISIDSLEMPSCVFTDSKPTMRLYISPNHFSKPNIRFIILHELQHRIDELNPDFGFDMVKKEGYRKKYGDCFAKILAHLWDIYINGRLDKDGLYEIDPRYKIGIKGKFLPCNESTERMGRINTLESGGVHNAEQVHDTVWNAKELHYTYDQLAQIAKDNMPSVTA